jgi:hypothetical protein
MSSNRNSIQSLLAIFAPLSRPLASTELDDYSIQTNETTEKAKTASILENKGREDVFSSPLNRRLDLRNWCLLGLAFSWVLSILVTTVGIIVVRSGRTPLPEFLHHRFMIVGLLQIPFIGGSKSRYIDAHRVFSCPHILTLLIPLLANAIVTAVLEAQHYIRATTLRWTLFRENRLRQISNSPLFVSSQHFGPNHWIINSVTAICTALCYGSTALLTSKVYCAGVTDSEGNILDSAITGPRYGVDFAGWSASILGVSLVILNLISTWAMFCEGGRVETWSSSPVDISQVVEALRVEEGRNFLGEATEMHNSSQQQTEREAVPIVPRLTAFLWVQFVLTVLWVIAVSVVAIRTKTTTREAVSSSSQQTDAAAFWQFYGLVFFAYYDDVGIRRDWLGVIIQSTVQGILSTGLHCADLIITISNDEEKWKRAYEDCVRTPGATELKAKDGLVSCSTVVLFGLKSVTQWVFGFALSVDLIVGMVLIPLVVLAIMVLCIALYVEFLGRKGTLGLLPTTYGNIEKLMIYSRKIPELSVETCRDHSPR